MFPEQGRLKIDQRDAFVPPAEAMRKHSMEEVDAILRADLARFEKGVATYCPVPLTQGQFDALVSFAFNLGTAALAKSTLLKKVKANPDDPAISREFAKWVNAGGLKRNGLVTRRRIEAELYFKPVV